MSNHPLLNSPFATRETIQLTIKRVLRRLAMVRASSLRDRDIVILNDQLLLLNYRKFLKGQQFTERYYTTVRHAALDRRNISVYFRKVGS